MQSSTIFISSSSTLPSPFTSQKIEDTGVAVAVGVGVNVGVAVAVNVGVGVAVGVDVETGIAVGVAIGVGGSVGVAVTVGVAVAVAVGVGVGVRVGVRVDAGSSNCQSRTGSNRSGDSDTGREFLRLKAAAVATEASRLDYFATDSAQ